MVNLWEGEGVGRVDGEVVVKEFISLVKWSRVMVKVSVLVVWEFIVVCRRSLGECGREDVNILGCSRRVGVVGLGWWVCWVGW